LQEVSPKSESALKGGLAKLMETKYLESHNTYFTLVGKKRCKWQAVILSSRLGIIHGADMHS